MSIDFDRAALTYDASRSVPAPVAELLYSGVMATPNSRILDAGGGTGRFAGLLLDRGLSTTVVDLSEAMLKVGRKNGAISLVVRGDAEHLPFREGAFTDVVLAAVLHVVSSPARVIHEAARVLVPGASAIVHVMLGREPLDEGPHRILARRYRCIVNESSMRSKVLDPAALRALCAKANLRPAGEASVTALTVESPLRVFEYIAERSYDWTWNVGLEQHRAALADLAEYSKSRWADPGEESTVRNRWTWYRFKRQGA